MAELPGYYAAVAPGTAAIPPLLVLPSSAARWKHAGFRGSFSTYRGVEDLVRNFNRNPDSWRLSGAKTYRFLREHLCQPEPGRPWSRAVSSEGTVAGEPRSREVLAEFGETAARLLVEHTPAVQTQALLLLAAVSSSHPAGINAAVRILGSPADHSVGQLTGALEVAAWCFHEPRELQCLFLHLDQHMMTRDAAQALARALTLRDVAIQELTVQRLEAWSHRLLQLLSVPNPGVAADTDARYATEALAAMLRARTLWPGLLAPGSPPIQHLRGDVLQRHDQLLAQNPTAHARTCATMRRLIRYLDGQGHGPVVAAAVDPAVEPPVPDKTPPPTQAQGISRPASTDVGPPASAAPEVQPTNTPRPGDPPPVQGVPHMQPDPDQRAVIEAPANSFLQVVAPPGAGKTAVACARIAWLAKQGVPPASILMISFTRVAVAEFRSRIVALAPEVPEIHGVEITTLDSHAWQILHGLDEQSDADSLFGSFDHNIETFAERIRSGEPAIRDWIGHYQHIVIDEAQDLVGPRAELVANLLMARSREAGATIFADEAQAIYGFTNDDDEDTHPTKSFTDALRSHGLEPMRCELGTIHRTDDPKLQLLFLEARRPISRDGVEPKTAWQSVSQQIEDNAHAELGEWDDTLMDMLRERDPLVLFRTRAQVLMASSFLHTRGIAHRVRMSGTPTVVEPWIGFLLGDFTDPALRQAQFRARWEEHAEHPCLRSSGRNADTAWSVLREIAPAKRADIVDIPQLRTQLARTRPPLSVCSQELGLSGPTIGTIHASKGREASDVVLMVPRSQAMHADSDFLEEARVLYVGATRARRHLSIAVSLTCWAEQLDDRRVFRKVDWGAQCEIGREGDLECIATVGRDLHASPEACEATQTWLAEHAVDVLDAEAAWIGDGDYRYRVLVEGSRPVGILHSSVNKALFQIARRTGRPQGRPPRKIKHLRILGATTVCLPPDHNMLPEMHEPYATSGIFLAPVVQGLVPVYFQTPVQPGGQW